MVIDSSVLLAILQEEPERTRHQAGLNYGDCFSYCPGARTQ